MYLYDDTQLCSSVCSCFSTNDLEDSKCVEGSSCKAERTDREWKTSNDAYWSDDSDVDALRGVLPTAWRPTEDPPVEDSTVGQEYGRRPVPAKAEKQSRIANVSERFTYKLS